MNASEGTRLNATNGGGDLISNLIELPRATGLTPLTALTQFTFACVAMGGFMFNQGVTVDEELALFSDMAGDISAQGRFTLEIIGRALEPRGVLPLAPYLMLAGCYILAYSIILHLHGLRHSWKSQLGFLVFILFPTNWLMQEWAGLAAALGIGLVCGALAAYLTLESMQATLSKASRAGRSVLAVALLVLSMSTFQSQITVYLAIGVGLTLFSFPGSSSHKLMGRFSTLGTWLVHGIASLAAYTLTTKLFLLVTAQDIQHVNIYFRNPYFMLRTEPVKYITGNLEQFARTYFTPGYFYGNPLFALSLLLIGSILLYLFLGRQRSAATDTHSGVSLRRGWQAWTGWLLLLALPLALNIISTPNRIPMRAFFALPYVAWLVTMVWLELSDRWKRLWTLRLGTFLACLLILQCLVTISNFYAARTFSQRSDQLVASTIASAIAVSPNQSQPVTRIVTIGSLSRKHPYRTAWYSFAGASFFNWDNGNTVRISSWLRAMGLPKLEPIKQENSQVFDRDFANMKIWPQPGSIRVVSQTVLVKLG